MRPQVVHFSSTPRPYKLSVSHCSAIDYPCTFATFEFTATSDGLEPGVDGPAGDIPAAFEIKVEASTIPARTCSSSTPACH